jgi:hypothetical protein
VRLRAPRGPVSTRAIGAASVSVPKVAFESSLRTRVSSAWCRFRRLSRASSEPCDSIMSDPRTVGRHRKRVPASPVTAIILAMAQVEYDNVPAGYGTRTHVRRTDLLLPGARVDVRNPHNHEPEWENTAGRETDRRGGKSRALPHRVWAFSRTGTERDVAGCGESLAAASAAEEDGRRCVGRQRTM